MKNEFMKYKINVVFLTCKIRNKDIKETACTEHVVKE